MDLEIQRKLAAQRETMAEMATGPCLLKTELEHDLYRALKQCLAILCEGGNLNNYRNLSDVELGRMWTAAARHGANLLNRIDGLPHD